MGFIKDISIESNLVLNSLNTNLTGNIIVDQDEINMILPLISNQFLTYTIIGKTGEGKYILIIDSFKENKKRIQGRYFKIKSQGMVWCSFDNDVFFIKIQGLEKNYVFESWETIDKMNKDLKPYIDSIIINETTKTKSK